MNQWFIMLNLTQISHLDISFSLLYTTNFTFVITNDDCNLFFTTHCFLNSRVPLVRVCVSRDPAWTIWTPFISLWNWPTGPIKMNRGPFDFTIHLLPSCSHQKLSLSIQKDLKMNKLWHRKPRNLPQVGNIQNFGPLKLSLDPLHLGFAVRKKSIGPLEF